MCVEDTHCFRSPGCCVTRPQRARALLFEESPQEVGLDGPADLARPEQRRYRRVSVADLGYQRYQRQAGGPSTEVLTNENVAKASRVDCQDVRLSLPNHPARCKAVC